MMLRDDCDLNDLQSGGDDIQFTILGKSNDFAENLARCTAEVGELNFEGFVACDLRIGKIVDKDWHRDWLTTRLKERYGSECCFIVVIQSNYRVVDYYVVYCGRHCWHSLTHSRSPFEFRMLLEQRLGRFERNVRR